RRLTGHGFRRTARRRKAPLQKEPAEPIRQLRDGYIPARVIPVVDPVQHPEERERSEEHTSELQSRENLVCRLLLEKKKDIKVSGMVSRGSIELLIRICMLIVHNY